MSLPLSTSGAPPRCPSLGPRYSPRLLLVAGVPAGAGTFGFVRAASVCFTPRTPHRTPQELRLLLQGVSKAFTPPLDAFRTWLRISLDCGLLTYLDLLDGLRAVIRGAHPLFIKAVPSWSTVLLLGAIIQPAVPIHPRLRLLTTRDCVALYLVNIVIQEIIRIQQVAVAAGAVHALAGLLSCLLTIGHNDPIVVLGVLQIILGQYWITGSKRITRQGHVLLSNVRRRTPDFNVRTVRFIAACQWIVVSLAVTPTPSAILLSLPHSLPISTIPITSIFHCMSGPAGSELPCAPVEADDFCPP